jgi:hypothetical protein
MSSEAMAFARDGNGATQRTLESGKKTIVRLLKTAGSVASDAFASVRGSGASASGPASSTTHDLAFAELEAYLTTQAPLIALLYNAAATLANRYREQAQLLLEYGQALRALGAAEGGAVGSNLTHVGTACWASSTTAYEQAVCQTESFVEKLADFVRDARAVRSTLDERSRASRQLTAASNDVDRLRALLTALATSAAPTAMRERQTAEADMAMATRAAIDARTYYDKVAAAILSEVERMRASQLASFRTILLDFVSCQHRTELKLANAWEAVAARVGGKPEPVLAITLDAL